MSIVMLTVVSLVLVPIDVPSRVSATCPTLGPNFDTKDERVNVSDGHRIVVSISDGEMPVDCAIDTQRPN